jgi:hypothetical protein
MSKSPLRRWKAPHQYQIHVELKNWASYIEIAADRRHVFRDGEQQVGVAGQELLRAAKGVCEQIASTLDAYESEAVPRSFAWVKNKVIRQIVERDYRELTLILFPAGAWKSTVVLAGSVVEAILYDQLTRTKDRIRKAMSAVEAPKKKGGVVRDIRVNADEDEWRLDKLIKVAAELRLIKEEEENLTHQALRKYRNFIHPHRESMEDKALSDGDAMAALGALKVICDRLENSR